MINGVIMDMDGLLIDSEPFWRKAEIEAFAKLDCKLDDRMLNRTMGMRNDEVVKYWVSYFKLGEVNYGAIELDILASVQEQVEANGRHLPGVLETLDFFKNKQIPIALASSSPMGIIQSVVDTLGIEQYFKVMCSAEFEEFGKPHPAVFLSAANYLRIPPEECVVFEDSVNGLIAAKAAKMHCIAIPSAQDFKDKRYAIADRVFQSLAEFLAFESR
jgi:mannitol-1-/sugar-/sorbitol-6-/2-deoxyglucose-6-phosphatase